jgi:6-phosphogluconolactonase (cycloisomerase 2 family)
VTDAHPSLAPVNPDGTPGAVKEFPKPDGSEQAVGAVAATPDGAYLYVNEFQNSGSGLFHIAEFTIDQNTGDITHTTTIQVPNNGGLQVDPTGSVLAVAGYSNRLPENGSPKLSMYKIATDGSLTAVGDPISLFGTQVRDFLFDASGPHLFVLSNQAEPATPGSSLQAFQIDSTTGAATLLQSIPLSIDTTELAVADSKYVYLSGVGNQGSNIAGWSIQADGTLAPITGTPFGSGVNAYGLAATPDGSRIFANDLQPQNIAWFAVNSTGALTLGGTTAPNSIVPGERMMVIAVGNSSTAPLAIPARRHRDAKLPFGVEQSAVVVRLHL